MAGGFGGGEVGLDVGLVSDIGRVDCARARCTKRERKGVSEENKKICVRGG